MECLWKTNMIYCKTHLFSLKMAPAPVLWDFVNVFYIFSCYIFFSKEYGCTPWNSSLLCIVCKGLHMYIIHNIYTTGELLMFCEEHAIAPLCKAHSHYAVIQYSLIAWIFRVCSHFCSPPLLIKILSRPTINLILHCKLHSSTWPWWHIALYNLSQGLNMCFAVRALNH